MEAFSFTRRILVCFWTSFELNGQLVSKLLQDRHGRFWTAGVAASVAIGRVAGVGSMSLAPGTLRVRSIFLLEDERVMHNVCTAPSKLERSSSSTFQSLSLMAVR